MTELWVYVELCREGIRPVTFELLGKAAELSARCGGRVTAVALGDCDTGALIAAGADRIITNYPDRALRCLAEHGEKRDD